jgi:tRNA (guanosine-2'-O-)-methyltransferase
MHNTSAVMRSCEILNSELNVIETTIRKSIDKGNYKAPKNVPTSIHLTVLMNCVDTLKSKGYQIIATTPLMRIGIVWLKILIFSETQKALFFWNRKRRIVEEILQRANGSKNPNGYFTGKFEYPRCRRQNHNSKT